MLTQLLVTVSKTTSLTQARVKLAYMRILPVLPFLYDDLISANEHLC